MYLQIKSWKKKVSPICAVHLLIKFKQRNRPWMCIDLLTWQRVILVETKHLSVWQAWWFPPVEAKNRPNQYLFSEFTKLQLSVIAPLYSVFVFWLKGSNWHDYGIRFQHLFTLWHPKTWFSGFLFLDNFKIKWVTGRTCNVIHQYFSFHANFFCLDRKNTFPNLPIWANLFYPQRFLITKFCYIGKIMPTCIE